MILNQKMFFFFFNFCQFQFYKSNKSKVLIERGITENEGDIRAVICDFGLTITSQTRIGRGSQLQTLNGFYYYLNSKF